MRSLCTLIALVVLTTLARAQEHTILRMGAIAPEGTGWARELRIAFLEAAAQARAALDDGTLPKSLVKEAADVLAEYRASRRKGR